MPFLYAKFIIYLLFWEKKRIFVDPFLINDCRYLIKHLKRMV